MPAVDAIIQYGDIGTTGLVDEPSLLVQSISIKATREKQAWKGPNLATRALRYTDPQLSFEIKAIISENTDLADQHPGTQVLDLANYAGDIYGFDATLGIMVFEDPSRDLTIENPSETSFTVRQYPFVGEDSSSA